MTDHAAVSTTAADCERYWRAAGIGRRTAADMRQELEAHLAQALEDGRSVADVVGPDPARFAADWAAVQLRRGPEGLPSWGEVMRRGRRIRPSDWMVIAGILAVMAVVITFARGGESTMDNEIWRWIWIAAAAVFSVGEIFTAGFFMLPFAFGAIAALPLAWLDVNEIVQLVVFLGVSIVALLLIQRMVSKGDEHQPAVGANRFQGGHGVVIEPIDRVAGVGRVRVDTENWRATTDGDPIPEGTEVRIVDVRGTRLVVEPE
ncbi:MAG: NfeD family protein [Actinobacteria bacterium]|nr:NfeD family protein [Actinomycetota bacterium]